MATQSWSIFQEIEAAGGWYAYLQKDLLAPLLAMGLRKRMAAVRTGATTVLGTNHFPNELETVHPQIAPIAHTTNSAILGRLKTLGDSWEIVKLELESSRLSAEFEAIRFRMQDEKGRYRGVQNALLLTLGDPLMRAARATFARNVLGAGGYLCTENTHPTDLEAAIAAAMQLQPSVIVLCGADADYLDQGSAWLQAIHAALPQAILVLAGKPAGWEALQAHGITEPVFAGMDRVAFLERLFEQLHTRKEARP
jgi:methylmalonyl-CoA mutase